VFQPFRSLQQVCGWDCAINLSKPKQLKKSDVLTKADYIKILQRNVNTIVREIDKDFPCMACGEHRQTYHASHYYHAGGHSWMRFNFLNIWSCCVPCNVHLSGNLSHYQINLVKIGVFDILQNEYKIKRNIKYTKDDIKDAVNKIKHAKREWKKVYKTKLTNDERIGVRLWFNEQIGIYK
jgi:5-hydroxyisourate hydrolase-like protein (transthyretin family)